MTLIWLILLQAVTGPGSSSSLELHGGLHERAFPSLKHLHSRGRLCHPSLVAPRPLRPPSPPRPLSGFLQKSLGHFARSIPKRSPNTAFLKCGHHRLRPIMHCSHSLPAGLLI